MTVIAKFQGTDKRLQKGKDYIITISGRPARYCNITSPRLRERDLELLIPYESIGAFLRNWDEVKLFTRN